MSSKSIIQKNTNEINNANEMCNNYILRKKNHHLSVHKRNMKQQPNRNLNRNNRFSRPGGTESDQVVSPGTSKRTCRVVISVAVSARTSVLKHGRVTRRRTSLRRRVSTGAAKLRRIKRRASALTRRDGSGFRIHDPKLVRTNRVDVGDAAGVLAVAGASLRFYPHLDVVTVDETHVVEVLAGNARSDGELG